ncbi:hypothetical protein M409DRAFT_24025 [Zasmidium cellare ATCC 36951]|uniref:Xylanolytic transcriptional activator regulatory domain-containing protein n=1 Tax=Zasmidium cellare ATCC 36951 TaxID=1080233 RepID=A0A6A6CEU3_ZASCE|nr:uncharacterized protein M409DRAFT_24025 [Zasmidium cellare ATCC 36951]KAF2165737.1 hypothetical protein M409DRAFT_24025 [Zasmidium cellare ATCC 36951]
MSEWPDLCTLRSIGVLGVEIVGLATFFLQCVDRKEDAYVYAGLAVRLAIVQNLFQKTSCELDNGLEVAHRTRLAWTIYMQEKRLAAATGNPSSINDAAIIIELPKDATGLCSPSALNLNIELARTSGRIISTIYAPDGPSGRDFCLQIEKILQEISGIMKGVPPELDVDFDQPIYVSRTSATLQLMLFQAIVLATRPILLLWARGMMSQTSYAGSWPRNSARCSVQQLLAKFGFFDLDATFSAAFVLLLAEFVRPETSDLDKSRRLSIAEALGILQYMESQGNKTAGKRRQDIEVACSQLGISLNSSRSIDSDLTLEPPSLRRTEDELPLSQTIEVASVNNLSPHENESQHYSAFTFEDDFNLTGALGGDWDELERIIETSQQSNEDV